MKMPSANKYYNNFPRYFLDEHSYIYLPLLPIHLFFQDLSLEDKHINKTTPNGPITI